MGSRATDEGCLQATRSAIIYLCACALAHTRPDEGLWDELVTHLGEELLFAHADRQQVTPVVAHALGRIGRTSEAFLHGRAEATAAHARMYMALSGLLDAFDERGIRHVCPLAETLDGLYPAFGLRQEMCYELLLDEERMHEATAVAESLELGHIHGTSQGNVLLVVEAVGFVQLTPAAFDSHGHTQQRILARDTDLCVVPVGGSSSRYVLSPTDAYVALVCLAQDRERRGTLRLSTLLDIHVYLRQTVGALLLDDAQQSIRELGLVPFEHALRGCALRTFAGGTQREQDLAFLERLVMPTLATESARTRRHHIRALL